MWVISRTCDQSRPANSVRLGIWPEDAYETVYISNERKDAKWGGDEGLDKLTSGHGGVWRGGMEGQYFYFVTP